MAMTTAQVLIVIAALLAANLPFAHRKGFLIVFRRNLDTPLHLRLQELILLYFAIGIAAHLLEAQAYASAYPQRWEFYAITFCLFLVLAYPGFVYRYLWLRKHKS